MQKTHKLFSGVLATILALAPYSALAATSDGLGLTESSIGFMLPILTILYSVMIQLMFFALKFVDFFLQPDFMLAITNTDSNPLLEVWQVSRDIVNILFAMLLVSVAIYTIFRANFTTAKEYAGKFVLAVILVNFSWFAPRVVLDFSNVLTASIYSIPSVASPTGQTCTRVDKDGNDIGCLTIVEVIPYSENEAVYALENFDDSNRHVQLTECFTGNAAQSGETKPGYIIVNENICLKLAAFDETNQDNMFAGLIANYTRILQSGKLPTSYPAGDITGDPSHLGTFMEFVITLMLNFVLTAALAFPIMAMAVILFVRIFILWMTIAFMPFAFIGFLIGDKLGSANPMQIWTHFWKNAILPAVLAVPIAVGFIMINALTVCPFKDPNLPEKLTSLCKDGVAMPITGINSWWELIWYIMTIGVIYMGFFTVTKFTSISEKIGGFFQGLGNLAWKAPLAMPLPVGFKAPDGGSITALGAMNMANANRINARLRQGDTLGEAVTGRNEVSGTKDVSELGSDTIRRLGQAIKDVRSAPAGSQRRSDAMRKLQQEFHASGLNHTEANITEIINHNEADVGALDNGLRQEIIDTLTS